MTDDTRAVTPDDAGLPVVDEEGNQIGVAAAVDGDEVEIDLDPDVSDDARASLGWERSENVRRTLPAADLVRIEGDDALEALPKYDLNHEEDDGDVGPVLRVDLGEVNSRG